MTSIRLGAQISPAASVLAIVTAFVGCSASSGTGDDQLGSNGAGSAGSSGGAAASGGASLTAGTTSVGNGGQPMFGGGAFGSVTPKGVGDSPDSGCASTSQAAEEIIKEIPVEIVTREPVALFIMMDRSGSMVTGFPAPASPDSWNNATAAVAAFVNDPASEGIDVGLGTFPFGPDNTADCGGSDCGRAVVPIAPLPGNAQAMVQGMQNEVPNSPVTLTPTECGLNGMIGHCMGFMQQSTTGEQCVAILVTDGTPTQCDTTQANLINIAANGFANGVLVYTLGMPGADMDFLNQMAQAGGTNAALDVTQGSQAFIDSLNAIRDSVTTTEIRTEIQSTQLDCSWLAPTPPDGEEFDEGQVNVQFEASGIARQGFGKVPDKQSCSQYQGGWYIDRETVPDRLSISVCDESCTLIKGATGARIDIILGCASEPAVPR